MGNKSWRETFGTNGLKVLSLSRWKFWKFDPWSHLKRTESNFWSHIGQKHHLVARRSKRPIRNFWPWGGQNGKKILGRNFTHYWHKVILSSGKNLDSVLLRCDHGSNFQNFYLDILQTFTPMVPKVFLQEFLPILAALLLKITNQSFWPSCETKWCFWPGATKTWVRSLWGASNSQNFDVERLRTLTPMVPKVSLQDFLPILGTPRPKIGKNRRWGAKMSKKSWRETFGFTGVKFRCEILSPGEKFGNLTNLVASHERSHVLVARRSKNRIIIFGRWAPKTGKKS